MATARGPVKHGSAGSTRSTMSSSSQSSQGSVGMMKKSSSSDGLASRNGMASKSKARPSDRLNPKTVDPFSSKGSCGSTSFSSMYNSGSVPCRLVHGSVKHKLAWNTSPETVPYDPVLVTLAEGIREKVHPYTFVARAGFRELLDIPEAGEKARPLLSKVVPPIRMALADSDGTVFEAGLEALVQLSDAVGPFLNPHLKMMLVPISKRTMEKKYKEPVMDALQQLESNGGKEALVTIKAKIPTYFSINT